MAHRVLAIFRRRLFNFLTILSLLLCLATVALWVRSHWRLNKVSYAYRSAGAVQSFGIQSVLGELDISSERDDLTDEGWFYYISSPDELDTFRFGATQSRAPEYRTRSLFGFGYIFGESPTFYVHSVRLIWFPHWFPALLFAILPALRLRSILRTRRRHRVGLCSHCGYDLRATPDRCPECGNVRGA